MRVAPAPGSVGLPVDVATTVRSHVPWALPFSPVESPVQQVVPARLELTASRAQTESAFRV